MELVKQFDLGGIWTFVKQKALDFLSWLRGNPVKAGALAFGALAWRFGVPNLQLLFTNFALYYRGKYFLKKVPPTHTVKTGPFRITLGSIDWNLHCNNSEYSRLAQLSKTEWVSVQYASLKDYGYSVAFTAAMTRFRRELRLMDKYHIACRVIYWERSKLVMEQRFVVDGPKGEFVHAIVYCLYQLVSLKTGRKITEAALDERNELGILVLPWNIKENEFEHTTLPDSPQMNEELMRQNSFQGEPPASVVEFLKSDVSCSSELRKEAKSVVPK